jgi:flagellar assembly factor FliW
MELTNLSIALVLSEKRSIELEKKIKGFEEILKVFSKEIDRQQSEIELMKRQGKVLKFNPLKKAA